MPASIAGNFTTWSRDLVWTDKEVSRRFAYYGTVADATPTELFVDGVSGQRVGIPTAGTGYGDCAVFVRATFVSFDTTDNQAEAGSVVATYTSIASTVAEDLADAAEFTGGGTSGVTGIALAADNTNKAFTVTYTGEAAKTNFIKVVVDVYCVKDGMSKPVFGN